MINIEEAYKFSLRVEEKLNKKFDRKKRGHNQGGRGGGRSFGGRNEDLKKNDNVGTS